MHEGQWRSCSVEFTVPIGVDPFAWFDDPEYKDLVTIKDGVKTIDLSKRKDRFMFSHQMMIDAQRRIRAKEMPPVDVVIE
jgi:hypothetical protein